MLSQARPAGPCYSCAMRSLAVKTLVVLAGFAPAAVVRAQDQQQAPDRQRFHVGIAFGETKFGQTLAEVSEDMAQFWGDRPIPDDTGWKVVAGIRPIRVVGAEVQYVDFGTGRDSAKQVSGAQVRVTTAGL